MERLFTEFEAKKQELNCGVNIIPIIKYIENLIGYEETKRIIEPLGLPLVFLLNKRNWVSHNYYKALLDKLVEVTGDEKAPFKIAFNMGKPQSIFTDLQYAAYGTLFLGNPKNMYKLIFNKDYSKRFSKIGEFEILEIKNNYIKVKLKYMKGYDLHKYNLEAIRGYMSFGTVSCGLEPADVVLHENNKKEDYNYCIYEIRWKQQKSNFALISSLGFLLLLSLSIVFSYIFKIKLIEIMFILSIYIIIILIIRSLILLNKLKFVKIYNYEKNDSLLEAMEKIENDYNEILDTKMKLEEHNKFLTIINEINKAIVTSFGFDNLLLIVSKLFSDHLKVNRGIYFQFDFKKRAFRSIFEILMENNEFKVYYNKYEISFNDYNKIKKLKYTFNKDDLNTSVYSKNDSLSLWINNKSSNLFHVLPIEIPDTLYTGFFLLNSDIASNITTDFYNMLFDSVTDLLKIAYQKISSRYVIESILSSIPACVLIFDINKFEVKYVNTLFLSAFQRLLNISSDKIVDSSVFDILPFDEETKKKVVVYVEKLLNGEQLESYEINIGTNIYEYSLFNISQLGHDEKLVGIILNDITEAKSFQQKLLINQKLIALGKVASGIAHEINNPLYAILANAEEIAEDKNASESTRQYAEETIEHVMNVSNIIKDLSSYSKTLRKENLDEINLNDIIEESLKLVRYSSNFLEVEIIKNLGNLPLIKATKGEMEQVFINLFNNAIHAMNGKGYLTIESTYENNEIKIKISDTGTGIKEDVLPHIFELYFTTKQPGEGTGQGLHIVKKILSNHKATINVESVLNKGTSFYIIFKLDDNNKLEVKN